MRRISWLRTALNDFQAFPLPVQDQMKAALEIAAVGAKADIAKPMKGLDAGVYEIAVAHRSDAFRAIYALKIGSDIWVIHAFQKKSKQGIKTPKHDIDLIRHRVKRLREMLK
jgi:phage-related protein